MRSQGLQSRRQNPWALKFVSVAIFVNTSLAESAARFQHLEKGLFKEPFAGSID